MIGSEDVTKKRCDEKGGVTKKNVAGKQKKHKSERGQWP